MNGLRYAAGASTRRDTGHRAVFRRPRAGHVPAGSGSRNGSSAGDTPLRNGGRNPRRPGSAGGRDGPCPGSCGCLCTSSRKGCTGLRDGHRCSGIPARTPSGPHRVRRPGIRSHNRYHILSQGFCESHRMPPGRWRSGRSPGQRPAYRISKRLSSSFQYLSG